MKINIEERVHEMYHTYDYNCARTTLMCLSEEFGVKLEKQTLDSAIGMHGAGRYRAQCGLVEGTLMFIGFYFADKGKSDSEIAALCYRFAGEFTEKFGSLTCRDLRPGGFNENDPPHLCEKLSCETIEFAREFIKKAAGIL